MIYISVIQAKCTQHTPRSFRGGLEKRLLPRFKSYRDHACKDIGRVVVTCLQSRASVGQTSKDMSKMRETRPTKYPKQIHASASFSPKSIATVQSIYVHHHAQSQRAHLRHPHVDVEVRGQGALTQLQHQADGGGGDTQPWSRVGGLGMWHWIKGRWNEVQYIRVSQR